MLHSPRRTHVACAAAIAVVAVACEATTTTRRTDSYPLSAQPVGTPLGSTHVPPAKRVEEPRLRSPSVIYALTDLNDAVEMLGAGAHDLRHAALIRALRALADALALVERPSTRAEVAAVRRAADNLEHSPADSEWHTDWARYALDATLRVLTSVSMTSDQPTVKYRSLVAVYAERLEAIDKGAPLLEEHAEVVGAMRTATEALLMAHDVTAQELGRVSRRAEPMRSSR